MNAAPCVHIGSRKQLHVGGVSALPVKYEVLNQRCFQNPNLLSHDFPGRIFERRRFGFNVIGVSIMINNGIAHNRLIKKRFKRICDFILDRIVAVIGNADITIPICVWVVC